MLALIFNINANAYSIPLITVIDSTQD
ncbi:hypothetical protein BN1200_650098 [Klebsiella variicola]|nr:hypothetical protein BN1200_650098 [Klebsiella variicola]